MLKFFIFLSLGVCFFFLFVWIYPYFATRFSSILILNAENKKIMPKEFRITPLAASASAQFSLESLQKMLETLQKSRIIIVDLREESHGFINGIAVSWYSRRNWSNQGKSKNTVIEDEKGKIQKLSDKFFTFIFMHKIYPIPFLIRSSMTEEELAHSLNVDYLRLPITDHLKPLDPIVDEFVEFIQKIPKDTWLHFHCSAGKGRSSTMLTMLDMMHHAQQWPFSKFISRQIEFDGIDLLHVSPQKNWKHGYLKERVLFLQEFHLYCQEQAPHFRQSWSSWKQSK